MKTQTETDFTHSVIEEDPGFTPEERAALKELGWREGRGQFDPDWKPLPKRPTWLAFIYRMLRIGEI